MKAFFKHKPLIFTVMICSAVAGVGTACRRESAVEAPVPTNAEGALDPAAEYRRRLSELEQTVQSLQQSLQEQEQQKQALETSRKQEAMAQKALMAELKKQAEDANKALYMYQSADLLTPPRSKNTDVFPIRVYNINYIYADNSPEGEGKLRFGLRNLTKTDKCVFLSTGKERKRITLASGADETLEMWGKLGKPIRVDVNHLTRSYDVTQNDPSVPTTTSPAEGVPTAAQ